MNPKIACLILAVAQLSVSANVVISKDVLSHIDSFSFACMRFITSFVLLLGLFLSRGGRIVEATHPEGRLTREDWVNMLGQGMTGGFLFTALFYYGLQFTTATSAGIIASTLPGMIAILGYVILKEEISRRKWMAIGLSILGIAFLGLDNAIAKDGPTGSFLGDFLILFAMLPEAYYSIYSRRISGRVTPMGAGVVACGFTALALLPFMLYNLETVRAAFDAHMLQMVFWGGMTSFAFFWLWPLGLKYVPVSTAALFGGLLPVGTAVMAVLFLGETLHLSDMLGMSCVLGSIYMGSARSRAVATPEVGVG